MSNKYFLFKSLYEIFMCAPSIKIRDAELITIKTPMITLDIKLSPLFQNSEQTTLNDISVKVKAGKLLAVIGPVGAGKVRDYLE